MLFYLRCAFYLRYAFLFALCCFVCVVLFICIMLFCLRSAFLFALCFLFALVFFICVVLYYLRCAFPGYLLRFKIYVRTPALNRFVFFEFGGVFFFVCVFFFCLYWPFYLGLPSVTKSLFHCLGGIKRVHLLPNPRSPFPVSITSFSNILHSLIYLPTHNIPQTRRLKEKVFFSTKK